MVVESNRAGAVMQVIPSPKQRSSRWVSSSVPEARWDIPLAQTSSAAYHVNNLIMPVLFVQAVAHIPANAVVVELAPHSLLQTLLRRSLPQSCTLLGLLHKQRPHSLLANLGRSVSPPGSHFAQLV
ncbi:hypothetical protein PR048_020750 [Dryococelus australis]|uniref:Malonyl-CoA:ACP transacylase (MAT) domain-containing protein n=1 Tax=Dryococelus australis TaxID=614101 RepID=A0ABQ9GW94_9NEOP|nr:hypothetical protein PR048_020750 [Dryococelus australis]